MRLNRHEEWRPRKSRTAAAVHWEKLAMQLVCARVRFIYSAVGRTRKSRSSTRLPHSTRMVETQNYWRVCSLRIVARSESLGRPEDCCNVRNIPAGLDCRAHGFSRQKPTADGWDRKDSLPVRLIGTSCGILHHDWSRVLGGSL